MANNLLEAYSGDKAREYDMRRATSTRWRREVEAMQAILDQVGPRSIVDCPFGTGRWIPQFEASGATVTGIDLSQNMLDEAVAKIAVLPADRRGAYNLICQSIFDIEPKTPRPDLTVCIRFLNWVTFSDVSRALRQLTALGSPHMVVGASLVPKSAGRLRRLWYRLSLALINIRNKRNPIQYVHSEAEFLALIDQLGWKVISRREIMRRNARVNFFFLLGRL